MPIITDIEKLQKEESECYSPTNSSFISVSKGIRLTDLNDNNPTMQQIKEDMITE